MSANLPSGRSIRDFSFEDFRSLRDVRGYVYPKRNVSKYIPLLSGAQRAALNFWAGAAILFGIAAVILPFVLEHWAWASLIVIAIGLWKANRQSMEQFFLEQLKEDERFFNEVKEREDVRVVFKS
jgi:hypothetical protein